MNAKKKHKSKIVKEQNFLSFLREKEQIRELLILFFLFFLVFILFSYCYPYPDTSDDTLGYVLCAKTMQLGGMRPIGYSWFLNYFHRISASTHFLFFSQFLLYALSTTFFIYTIKYFFKPRKRYIFYLLVLFISFSPSAIYLTNHIGSDTIFVFLTTLWITSGIWVIAKKNKVMFLIHIIALYLAIQVRYTGLFYPVISMLVCLFTWGRIGLLLAIIPIIVVGQIYLDTEDKIQKLTGIKTFSAFGGWQLANNALHIIPYIDLNPRDIKDNNIRFIHEVVSKYDSSKFYKYLTTEYMWDEKFPLVQAFIIISQYNNMNYMTGWTYSGTLLKQYGMFLIKKYPNQFFRYFILKNIRVMMSPRPEFFNNYRAMYQEQVILEWFSNIDDSVKFKPKWDFFHKFISPLLLLSNTVLWYIVLFILGYGTIKRKQIVFQREQKLILFYLFLFGMFFFLFSVFASPIRLRYITPIHIIQISLPYIIFNSLIRNVRIGR